MGNCTKVKKSSNIRTIGLSQFTRTKKELLIKEKEEQENEPKIEANLQKEYKINRKLQSFSVSSEAKHSKFFQEDLEESNNRNQTSKNSKKLEQFLQRRKEIIKNHRMSKSSENLKDSLLRNLQIKSEVCKSEKKALFISRENRDITFSNTDLLDLDSIYLKYYSDFEIFHLNSAKKKTENSVLVFSIPIFHDSERLNLNLKAVHPENLIFLNKTWKKKLTKNNTLYFNTLKFFPNRWKKGKIPYLIDKSLIFVSNDQNQTLYNTVKSCIKKIETKTVLKFVSFDKKKHKNFVFFQIGLKNSALIGKHKGKNLLELKKNASEGDIFHQIMHCLGFMHMHQKKNKEAFVYFEKPQIFSNVLEDFSYTCVFGLQQGPFDLNSVLFLKSCENMISYFSQSKSENFTLSDVDCDKINFFYCEENLEKTDKEILGFLDLMKIKADFSLINF